MVGPVAKEDDVARLQVAVRNVEPVQVRQRRIHLRTESLHCLATHRERLTPRPLSL